MWLFDMRRYLRLLLGDTGPGAVGLGLALGILAGFPPFGFITALVIGLFLVLRANLAVFVIGLVLARVVGVVLSPAFHAVGEAVLDPGALRGLWAWLLNVPGVCLLDLDRYVVFGGVLVGVLAGVCVHLAALFGFPLLRRGFWSLVNRSDRVRRISGSWMGRLPIRLVFGKKPGSDDDEVRKGGLIRKGFVIPTAVFVVLVGVLIQLFGSTLFRRGSELLASRTLGKDVTIQTAALGFLGGSINLGGLRVNEPDPERKATGEIAQGQRFVFDLSPWQILASRFVVDELLAENLVYHAGTESIPPMPPEPEPGVTVGIAEVVEFVKANEKQIRWVLDQLDGFLKKGDEAPSENTPGFEGRAAYISAARTRPAFLARSAAVKNLVFDWNETRGPLTALRRLDLVLRDLSSNPVRHAHPVTLEGSGDYGPGTVELKGVFDVRAASTEGHRLDLAFNAATFGRRGWLGIGGGKDLAMTITTRFDAGTRALSGATCQGSFVADNEARIDFKLGLADARTFEVGIAGLDVTRASAFKWPDAIRVDGGMVDVRAAIHLAEGGLGGSVKFTARDLTLQPGSLRSIAGIPAGQLCKALNALTRSQPLGLALLLGGSPSSPSVRIEDGELKHLLEQVKTGLVQAGEQALAAEMDRRLGGLSKEIGKKVGIDTRGIEKIIGGETKKKVGSVLGGLFGGKKPKKPEPKKRP